MAAWQIQHCKTLQPNKRNFKAAFFPSIDKVKQDTEQAQYEAYILYKEAYDSDCSEEEFWQNCKSRTEEVAAAATAVTQKTQFALTDEDRYYTMDSGASQHIAPTKELTVEESKTIRKLDVDRYFRTANGRVKVTHSVQLFIRPLGITVTALICDSSPLLISIGKLCEETCDFLWKRRGIPTLCIYNADDVLVNEIVLETQKNIPYITPMEAEDDEHDWNAFDWSPEDQKKCDDEDDAQSKRQETTSSQTPQQSHESSTSTVDPQKTAGKSTSQREPQSATTPKVQPDIPARDNQISSPAPAKADRAPPLHVQPRITTRTAQTSAKQKGTPICPPCNIPLSEHNIFTHNPKHPLCPICNGTKTQRQQCRKKRNKKSKTPQMKMPEATEFAHSITLDHLILKNTEDLSRNKDRVAAVVLDIYSKWLQAYASKTNSALSTKKAIRRFLGPQIRPDYIFSDNSKEIRKAVEILHCEDVHDTSTPNRPQSNGMIEQCVRTTKEGTNANLMQSNLSHEL